MRIAGRRTLVVDWGLGAGAAIFIAGLRSASPSRYATAQAGDAIGA